MIIELTYSAMSHNSGEFDNHDLWCHSVKILILVNHIYLINHPPSNKHPPRISAHPESPKS